MEVRILYRQIQQPTPVNNSYSDTSTVVRGNMEVSCEIKDGELYVDHRTLKQFLIEEENYPVEQADVFVATIKLSNDL